MLAYVGMFVVAALMMMAAAQILGSNELACDYTIGTEDTPVKLTEYLNVDRYHLFNVGTKWNAIVLDTNSTEVDKTRSYIFLIVGDNQGFYRWGESIRVTDEMVNATFIHTVAYDINGTALGTSKYYKVTYGEPGIEPEFQVDCRVVDGGIHEAFILLIVVLVVIAAMFLILAWKEFD